MEDVTLLSSDVQHYIVLKKGTYCLDVNDAPVYWIYFRIAEDDGNLPLPPEGSTAIMPYYEIDPSGTTFNPPVPCTFRYKFWGLSEGANPDNLTVMVYDEAAEQWTPLQTQVNAAESSVTAFLDHLSLYTVMLMPRPAEFELSGLSITPAETDIDGEVTVSITVTNTGDTSGDCTVTCKVNGTTAAEQSVTVAAGESRDVVFTLAQAAAGTYTVDVNGMTGRFTVSVPPQPEPTQEPETVPAPTPEAEPEAVQQPEAAPAQPQTTQPTTPADEDIEEPESVGVGWWLYVVIIAAVVFLGLGGWQFYRRWTAKQIKTQ